VRRSIDWSDTKFLEQLVRLGLKAGDEGWRRSWEELCERKEVAPTFSGQKPPRQVLVEFVEINLYQTSGKEWAQPLLYKAEGEEDAQIDLPTSDEENHGKLQPGESDLQVAEDPEPVLLVGVGEASSSKTRPEMPDQRDQISNQGGPDPDMEVSIQKEDLVPTMTEVGPAISNAEIGETRKEKKKDKKERKEKKEGDKSKKVKKEKRRLEDESLQAGEKSQKTSKVAECSSDSGSEHSIAKAPPEYDHKVRLCAAFLEGRCHKGSLCKAAHSQSELMQPGEAASQHHEKLVRAGKHPSQGSAANPPRVPGNRMRAWPQDSARSRGVTPRPIMGMPPMMDPMMMGAPGHIMVVPPEMIHMQVPQFHPQMAMMMDPYLMMHQEKHHRKSKESKEGKEKGKEKGKKAAKEVEVLHTKQKDTKELKSKKDKSDKSARRKDKTSAVKAGTVRKERKVDEEDL